MHRQKWVKINSAVDDKVAALINSLNAFPRLQTMESCQGAADRPAWVSFRYGNYWTNPWRELAHFVLDYLGQNLAHEIGDRADIAIRVTESGLIQGELTVRPGAIQSTIEALNRLADAYND